MPTEVESIDSDVDLRVAEERAEFRNKVRIIAAVSIGGMIGALARYELAQAWPTPSGGFPSSTFTINVTGCLVLGTLMSIVVGRERVHPLVRPFVGTGVLGGYTTFSTYAVETNTLLQHHHPLLGLIYVFGSVVAGVIAALVGHALGDQLIDRTGVRR